MIAAGVHVALCVALGAGQPADGAPPEAALPVTAENEIAAGEITPRLDEAVAKGLAALAQMQNSDGTFGQGNWGRSAAITALAGLAFMADGNLPGRGVYAQQISRALDAVLQATTESGLIAGENAAAPMYGHGFASLFLGEIYGMGSFSAQSPDDRVYPALLRSVRLIESTQNNEGGWRYNPIPSDADVSVTICQIMALRSARNAGLEVPKETIDRAVKYVRQCQNPDGGFRYQLVEGESAFPRSAAGVASLQYAGVYDDDAVHKGLEYILKSAMPDGHGTQRSHYFYGQYYAVQAMYQAGGPRWALWWPAIRDELLAMQGADGTWSDPSVGDAYATAMALIILQMPKRYLPIFQR